jgi:alpha-glucoside transport system permease protein
MLNTKDSNSEKIGFLHWFSSTLGQILISLFVPAITFYVLWQGYIFLSKAQASQIVLVTVAIIWGVGGVALLYVVANWLVLKLPKPWSKRLQPFVFVGPAVVIMGWFLAIPVIRSLIADERMTMV